ncbi:transposase [Acidisoma cellulosilyticum]|nr:transposase [Acidisoma cellulosilyticum]
MAEMRYLIIEDRTLSINLSLLRSITGFGEISAIVLLTELPNIAEFTPMALAAFSGLSPGEHSSGSSVRRPGKLTRIGSERLRSALYMCALSARRTNKSFAEFVHRLTAASKPPKVILIAVARKLLMLARAVIKTQQPFDPLYGMHR